MRFSIVKAVFLKELREMLRDRRSLAVMFGLPLVLYPLLAIGIANLGASRTRELSEEIGRIAVRNIGAAPNLYKLIEAEGSGLAIAATPPSDAEEELAAGHLSAIVEIPPDYERRAIAGTLQDAPIRMRIDRSRTSSLFVERKIDKAIDAYQRWVVEQRLARAGVRPTVLEPLEREVDDIATSDQRFGKILAQALPLLLLMTGMLGALFPALNATTTERELGTLETLLVTPAGRMELLAAKGALVLLCGLLTAGLNMLSMSLVLLRSISLAVDASGGGDGTQQVLGGLAVSPAALALTYLAAVPALIFFSAIVLITGLLARNYREANAFATPVMLLPLVSLGIGIAEPELSNALLVTPVVNTTIIIREVLTGRVGAEAFALAFASSCLYAGLMLSLAARLFSSEQLVNPAWEPLTFKGFKRGRWTGKRVRRLPAGDEAIALFAVSLLLLFYVSPEFVRHGLVAALLGNQLLLMTLPAVLLAWVGGWDWRRTFLLHGAPLLLLAGAGLVGIGMAPWVKLVGLLQHQMWPQSPEASRPLLDLLLPPLTQHPILTIVFVGTMAGVFEELFFRGPIQTALVHRSPPWFGIACAAFLFAAVHMDLHGLPIRFALGVLLGWIAWRGQSIYPAMLAHALYDAAQLADLAWHVHRMGAEQLIAAASGDVKLEASDFVALAIGAALIAAGLLLCRTVFAKTPPAPADGTLIAAQPA